jgi:SpoVK/Ycf46/Vps4 family AAA+-type ATPase
MGTSTSKLFGSLSSLVPFWANSLIIYLGLGTEYSMLLNIVLSEFLSAAQNNLSSMAINIIIGLVSCVLLAVKFNLFTDVLKLLNLTQPYTITVSGNSVTKNYPIAMIALTEQFVGDCKIKNLILTKDTHFDIGIGDLSNYKISNGIFLNIVNQSNGLITYTLKSYTEDLKVFVESAIEKHSKLTCKNIITISGSETETTYNYPLSMIFLTYMFVHKYQMSRYVIKKQAEDSGKDSWVNIFKQEITNRNKNKINNALSNLVLLDEYKDYQLDQTDQTDISVTIIRTGETIKYILVSESTDLREFIITAEKYFMYNVSKNIYTNRVVVSGSEIVSDSEISIKYPKNIFAINYVLINDYGVKNYKIFDQTNKQSTEYILDDLNSFEFDSIVLSVNRLSNTSAYKTFTVVDYVLESNSINLEQWICQCVEKYNVYIDRLLKDKIYHFTLTGFDSNSNPKFNSEILYGDDIKLFETFDNIHNEHSGLLKKDIDRLKNLDYYARTGLKRKKSYLFHGEPGCGKTSTVVAMSLYDFRHIVDIPFSLISKNSQLENIMNMDMINNIPIKKSQVIYLFDEIDTGMEGMARNTPDNTNLMGPKPEPENKSTTATVLETLAVVSAITESSSSYTKSNDLNIGKVLSKFDGICNYDGLIIVATTNYKEKLDPALYRELRLTPLYFTYLRQSDAIEIIEKFYEIKLNPSQISMIPDRKISPAKMVFLCEKYLEQSIDELLEAI